MNVFSAVLVGAGGAAGAVVRYAASRGFAAKGIRPYWATLLVNLAGSLAMGILIGIQLEARTPDGYALLGTGFLGGMTTYSTLNVQKAVLAAEGEKKTLARYGAATYLGGWAAIGAGLWLGQAFRLST